MKAINSLKFFAIALPLLAACASTPYSPSKKIESKGSSLFRKLTQDSKEVSRFDVLKDLAQNPSTREVGGKAQTWTYVSLGAVGVGGALAASNILGSNDSQALLLDLLIIGGGVGAGVFADKYFNEALEIHNSGKGHKKHGVLGFDVHVAQNAPVFGLKYSF